MGLQIVSLPRLMTLLVSVKTVAENWVSKQSWFVLILKPVYSWLSLYFLGKKIFLFVKIESWNFQHLFEKGFWETSYYFKSIRQPIEKIEITIVWIHWMSWNFVRFREALFQSDAESFSFLHWKTKKFYT
jgi:hypothetical protein